MLGLVKQVATSSKNSILLMYFYVYQKNDTTVVPSELNKMGKAKRTNEPPKYILYNETTEMIKSSYWQ